MANLFCKRDVNDARHCKAKLPWLTSRKHFKLTAGQELVRTYDDNDTEAGVTVHRSFCSKCGSPVFITNDSNPMVKDGIILSSGCLDERTREKYGPKTEFFCKRRREWMSDAVEDMQKFQAMQ
jgi:hypothetical protein